MLTLVYAAVAITPSCQRRAIEFIAEADRRTISQSLEFIVLDHVRQTLRNEFDSQGKLVKNDPFEFRPGKDPRSR